MKYQWFHSIRNSGNFEAEANGSKFPENSKIVIFPKRESFDRDLRKFREENQIEMKSPIRSGRKFWALAIPC